MSFSLLSYRHYIVILLLLSSTLFLNLIFISCVALISLLMTLLLLVVVVVVVVMMILIADDVYETVPNIKQAMISEVENMNTDIKVSACNLVIFLFLINTPYRSTPQQSFLLFILILTISSSPVSWLVYVE